MTTSAEGPSAHDERTEPGAPPGAPAPRGPEPPAGGYPPPAHPPSGSPEKGAPPPAYPPPGYGPPGYPPPPYPPPGYPPNGGAPGPAGTGPRQHAWRTPWRPPNDPSGAAPPNGGAPPRTRRPGGPARTSPRSLMWLIVVVAVVAILVRSHRITSNDVIFFCILIPSVILHEIAHGVVALAFGDDTAKRAGRLSLNPLRHVTAWGTVIVPAITLLAGYGFFGWAKPVPVNVRRLRSPRNQGLLVALAGPLTNVLLAAVFGVVFYLGFAIGHPGGVPTTLGARIVFFAGAINLWVACFNMIPIPPLDGSALVERLLPGSWWPTYLRFRSFGMLVVLGGIILLSMARVYPLQWVFTHIDTWWAQVVHAG